MNFQMFKLVLEKAEDPDIKLPTSTGSSKKQEFLKNIYFCFIDYTKFLDFVDYNNYIKFFKKWEYQVPDLPAEKSVCRSRSGS